METEVTLEELADRHPNVEKDVNQVTFEIEVSSTPPDDDSKSWERVKNIGRDITIGLVVFVLSVWLSPYVLALVSK